MDWTHVHKGFEDELAKIAAVHSRHLSPELLLERAGRGVFQSPALQKAKAIMSKTADLSTPAVYPGGSDFNAKPFSEDRMKQGGYEEKNKGYAQSRLRRYGRGALLGGTAGLALGGALGKSPNQKLKLIGGAVGAGAGLADRILAEKKKTSNVMSPAMQLKGTSQVGRTTGAPFMGETIKGQIAPRMIGNKFT